MVGAQTAPIRAPSTSPRVTASSSTPFFRFGSLSSLFGPSQRTTANVEGPPQGKFHRGEVPSSGRICALHSPPTPIPQPSPPVAGPGFPASVEQTPNKVIFSHTIAASSTVPTHPSSSVSVCSNHPSPSPTRQRSLPGPYDRIDRYHVPLSPSGLPTNSEQGQDDRGVRVAEDTSTKSPAQLMMAEMESRRPWGVRLLEAHTNTTEAIQSLQQTCSAIAEGQRATRDKIFEVQNALKALPTKEDIWEELNEQLPGLLETSLQPILDGFHNRFQALPRAMGTIFDQSIRTEADRIVEAIRQVEAERQSSPRRSPAEEPIVDLMKHMIAALNPLHELSSIVPVLESFSEVLPALKALPGAVQSVAIFHNALVKLGDRTKSLVGEPQLPTSAPQAGPNRQPVLPSGVGAPRFSNLFKEGSPDIAIDTLMTGEVSLSPGDTPLQQGQEAPVPEQVLYSPHLLPARINGRPVTRPTEATGMQEIADEVTKLSSAISKMENRFEQAFHSATDRAKILPDHLPIPSWMEKLDKRLEAMERALTLSARDRDSTKSMRTPEHHLPTATHLPTPASSSQQISAPDPSESCAYDESAVVETPVHGLRGALVDILDPPPQENFEPIRPIAAGGTNSIGDLPLPRSNHPVGQTVPLAPGRIAERARGTRTTKKRPASSSAPRSSPKRPKNSTNRSPPSSRPARRSPRGAAHGEPIVSEARAPVQPSDPGERYPGVLSQVPSNADHFTPTEVALQPLPTVPSCASSNNSGSTVQPTVETFVDPPSARTRGAAGIRKEIIQLKNKHNRSKDRTSITDSQDSGALTATSDCLKSKEETTGMTTSSSSSDDSRASDYQATRKKKASYTKKKKKRSKSGSSSAFKPAPSSPAVNGDDGQPGNSRPATTKSPPRDAFGRFIGGGVPSSRPRTSTKSRPIPKKGVRAPSAVRPSLSFRSITLNRRPPLGAMSNIGQTAISIEGDLSSTLESLPGMQNSAAAQPPDMPLLHDVYSYPETGASIFYESLAEGQEGAEPSQGGTKDAREAVAMGRTSGEQTLLLGPEFTAGRAKEISNVTSYYGPNKVQGRDLNGELSDEG